MIKLLEKNGWELERQGANHEIYRKGNRVEPVPRHREIAESLAKAIIKRQSLK